MQSLWCLLGKHFFLYVPVRIINVVLLWKPHNLHISYSKRCSQHNPFIHWNYFLPSMFQKCKCFKCSFAFLTFWFSCNNSSVAMALICCENSEKSRPFRCNALDLKNDTVVNLSQKNTIWSGLNCAIEFIHDVCQFRRWFCKSRLSQLVVKIVKYHLVLCKIAQ